MSLITSISSLFHTKILKSKDYTVQFYSRLMNNACFVIINNKEYPVYFNKTKTKAYVIRKAKSGMEYRQYFVPDMVKTMETINRKFPHTSFLIIKN